MRDIRSDLSERLEGIKKERAAIEARLAFLKETEDLVTTVLKREEDAWSTQQPLKFEPEETQRSNGKYDSPLAKLVLETLKESGGVCTLDDLKKAAFKNRIGFGDKKPGRSIHFLLVGMEQNKLVEGLGEGRWKLVE